MPGFVTALRIISAQSDDLGRYIDLLEEVAEWLAQRGINQWRPGSFRVSASYYAESIAQGEVKLAFSGEALIGTLRLLLREPIVWPEIAEDDAVYVYNLAVRREWASQQLGGRLLEWAGHQTLALGRRCVRLDCMADNAFLRTYYTRAGFVDRGQIDAQFPAPVGTLRLRRYEKANRNLLEWAAQHPKEPTLTSRHRIAPKRGSFRR
jgi:GNAT superfamily N-acetyltransferase